MSGISEGMPLTVLLPSRDKIAFPYQPTLDPDPALHGGAADLVRPCQFTRSLLVPRQPTRVEAAKPTGLDPLRSSTRSPAVSKQLAG